MGVGFHLWPCVFHCDRQAATAHYWEVDNIVTDEGGFSGGDSFLLEDLAEDACLILNALVDVIDFQISSAEGDSLRQAFGDQTSLQSGEAGQRNGGAVMGVKALGFDQAGALETESAFATVLIGLLQDALLGAGGGGEDPDFAVGEDAVDVEEDEFDFPGAGFRHSGRDFSILEDWPNRQRIRLPRKVSLHYRSELQERL